MQIPGDLISKLIFWKRQVEFAPATDFQEITSLDNEDVREWRALPPEKKIKFNIENINKHLITWGNLMQNGAPKNPYIVFMHIPKTGGATVKSLLAKNCNPNYLLKANTEDCRENAQLTFQQGDFTSVLMGHITLSDIPYQFIHMPFVHFMMLREPVKRIVSLYNYVSNNSKHPQNSEVSPMSIIDFVNSNAQLLEVHNGQTQRIIGYFGVDPVKNRVNTDEKMLDTAKSIIQSQFSLFGVTEFFAEFMIMMAKLLGWKDIFCTPRNVSSSIYKRSPVRTKRLLDINSLTEREIQRIKELNSIDIDLYNYARELFLERCRQLGVNADDVKNYHRKNAIYQDLLYNNSIN